MFSKTVNIVTVTIPTSMFVPHLSWMKVMIHLTRMLMVKTHLPWMRFVEQHISARQARICIPEPPVLVATRICMAKEAQKVSWKTTKMQNMVVNLQISSVLWCKNFAIPCHGKCQNHKILPMEWMWWNCATVVQSTISPRSWESVDKCSVASKLGFEARKF